jgi:hypothetical protein
MPQGRGVKATAPKAAKLDHAAVSEESPMLVVAQFLILLTGAASASATIDVALENWQVMVWSDPVVVSVDTSSIAAHGGRITARVMWDYAALQRPEPAAAAYRSMIGTLVFDCKTEGFGGAGSVSYTGMGGRGDPIGHYAINPDQAPLTHTEPGTVGHDLLTFVCAHPAKLALESKLTG